MITTALQILGLRGSLTSSAINSEGILTFQTGTCMFTVQQLRAQTDKTDHAYHFAHKMRTAGSGSLSLPQHYAREGVFNPSISTFFYLLEIRLSAFLLAFKKEENECFKGYFLPLKLLIAK